MLLAVTMVLAIVFLIGFAEQRTKAEGTGLEPATACAASDFESDP